MINGLYFLFLPLCAAAKVTVQGKCSKNLDGSVGGIFLFNALIFTALVAVMGALFWRCVPSPALILCSLLLGVSTVAFQVGYTMAFRAGSVSLATIINNFNVAFPLLFGVIVYHERLSVPNMIAFVFLCTALILIPSRGGGGTGARWLVFSLIAFFASGFSSCLMLWYARTFPAHMRNVFVICSYAWAAVFCYVIAFLFRRGAKNCRPDGRMLLGILGIGVLLGAYNLLLIRAVSVFPAAIFYPINNVLIMITIAAADYLLYRKKLTKKQFIGFTAGVICVILLNI